MVIHICELFNPHKDAAYPAHKGQGFRRMFSMKEIDIGRLVWETDEPLAPSQAHLLRGCISHMFADEELVHNHDVESSQERYRYPLIQFKIVNAMPLVVGIGRQAIAIVRRMAAQIKHLDIAGKHIAILHHTLEITADSFGVSQEFCRYTFLTPWIGLNSANYRRYCQATVQDKEITLKRCLIGNLLSVSKFLDYTVSTRLDATYSLETVPINLKGQTMVGFLGNFATNFYLPDFIGLGKSCSRGYGCCVENE
jgi:hypothetical protein